MAEINAPKYDIDVSIFTQMDKNCNLNHNNKLINNCTHLHRIIHALKYNQLLLSDYNQFTQNKFIEFCRGEYKMCVEDYIHFIQVHSDYDSLSQIVTELRIQRSNNFEICSNIDECKWCKRHCRNRNDTNEYNNDQIDSFIIDLFDTLHFYLFHIEMAGLRSSIKIQENKYKQNYEEHKDDIYFTVSEIQKDISKHKNKLTKFNKANASKYMFYAQTNKVKQQEN
eukprot:437745_1